MTLNYWFTKNTKTPLRVLIGFVVLIYICFVYFAFETNESHQTKSLKDLIVTSVIIGIQQNDRVLIESALGRAVENLGAKAAFLCKGNQVIFNTTSHVKYCSQLPQPTFMQRKILFSNLGFEGYKAHFFVPRYSIQKSYLWVFSIAFFVLLLSYGITLNIQRAFTKDILIPLKQNLLDNEGNFEIEEFKEIKEKIEQSYKLREQSAFTQALSASKEKFSHNIASPLRNIKILKNQVQETLDEDEKELFSSIIEEVSGLAENLIIKNPFERDRESKKPGKALIDIEKAINNSIQKKKMEWREKSIVIKYNHSGEAAISLIEKVEFSSILSNLLNNSFEAGASQISIESRINGSEIKITISDDGRGVPNKIKETLFEKNVTEQKEHGTGYGLFHARKYINSWSGHIKLIPTQNGTRFQITLPQWKHEPIKLTSSSTVALLEDQPRMRAAIKQAVISLGAKPSQINEFDNPASFLRWYEDFSDKENLTVLADNDLGEENLKGLHIISRLPKVHSSHLVTDGHEDSHLVDDCSKRKVNLIPKAYLVDPKIFSSSRSKTIYSNL